MSRGIGVRAELILQNENTVIYKYGGYNLNEAQYRNESHIIDGLIRIQRSCFQEPEIHEKIKRMPSGRKKHIVKRIPVSVDYYQMFKDGLIEIKNCSTCWEVTDDDKHIDVMAFHLL